MVSVNTTSRVGRQYYAAGKISRKDQTVISKIVAEFTDRSRKDIQTWRQALDAADHPENPRWAQLQDLYEYLRPDGHLGSQIDIRKGATEANRFLVRDSKNGKEDPAKTKLLETEWFFNLMGDLLDCNFFGYSVLQLSDPIAKKFELIPRRNFVPQRDVVLLEVSGDQGVSITDPAFSGSIICVKSQYKFGIMNDIVPDLIWKKNARQAWAEFSEKFGLPMITATTNKQDVKELDRIEAMIRQLGQAAQAVLPEGTTVDIKGDTRQGDPYNVFLKQMEYNDRQISKRILGGTMVSDNGSSRSQSEVHERTMNYIIAERDRRKIEFAVNGQLLPILRAIGEPFAETDEFAFDRSEDLRLSEHWTIVREALDHFEIPTEWVAEKFNFPITGRKEPPAPATPPVPGNRATAFSASYGSGFFD